MDVVGEEILDGDLGEGSPCQAGCAVGFWDVVEYAGADASEEGEVSDCAWDDASQYM